jgi:hypothetical protein
MKPVTPSLYWRGGERLHGDDFFDRVAPFYEIVINPCLWDADGNLPPLLLADGTLYDAAGTVVGRGFRIPVPMMGRVRGGARALRRKLVERAKLEADVRIIGLLAGPFVEQYEYADGWFDWREDEDFQENRDNDVTRAFAIARDELCRTERQACRYMDDAIDRLAGMLQDDPRYWRTINALAAVLARRHRVDHDGAIRIMRRAWGSTPTTKRD